ncbi:hypothetical protein BUALT_Bualt18G0127600 [Buddleja alternifolia]|uniref:F-box domain-containing protein n=1 Tax=Buddleja alternifolia TaxID=168488 RepID=A0AAV6WAB2_9LAMI|nr:hypothetical protein BUALT_Bualt18G0127600 [Buddleja alternifolia]
MASSSTSEDATPPWLELPPEITAAILHKLGAIELLTTVPRVCTTWRSVCQDVAMWRCIDMKNTGNRSFDLDLEEMCRHAVDRSQGQLIDINIECSQLRRLQLVFAYGITGKGVAEAVTNFPLLEELHLYYTSIDTEAIETVGRSCPLLKSFKLNYHWYKGQHMLCDSEAIAIAEYMPELRHLQLFGNKMTNVGLQAILNGCPNLKSLDLRQCFDVHFGGNLGRLCSERIKDLRRPHDSTDDYQFDAELYESSDDDDDYITGFSDMDLVSDYDDYLEFSGGSTPSYENDNPIYEYDAFYQ